MSHINYLSEVRLSHLARVTFTIIAAAPGLEIEGRKITGVEIDAVGAVVQPFTCRRNFEKGRVRRVLPAYRFFTIDRPK